MPYERAAEMNARIDYDAIKAQKREMLQSFLQAKKRAEEAGQVISKPI
jgi:hypothetical protein